MVAKFCFVRFCRPLKGRYFEWIVLELLTKVSAIVWRSTFYRSATLLTTQPPSFKLPSVSP